jgi:hypothetical protein
MTHLDADSELPYSAQCAGPRCLVVDSFLSAGNRPFDPVGTHGDDYCQFEREIERSGYGDERLTDLQGMAFANAWQLVSNDTIT